jgi:hypothetical protein
MDSNHFSCQVGPFQHGMGHSQFADGIYVLAELTDCCEYIEKAVADSRLEVLFQTG